MTVPLLSGCTSNKQRGTTQELRFNLRTDPLSFDPSKCADHTSAGVIHLCFEGLTRLDAEGKPELALASSVDVSEDKMRYLFHLKEAYWSDGRRITASDFENSWKKILDPSFPCEFTHNLYVIKQARAAKTAQVSLDHVGVRALDAETLQVHLEHPAPSFLASLACTYFFPSPTPGESGLKSGQESAYVVSGPFCIQYFQSQDRIVFAKNPFYWDQEQVRLDRVTFFIIQDEGTELSLFEQGELDWAGYPLSNLPTDAIRSLAKQNRIEEYPIAGTYFYVFNTTQFPFNNVHMRRAFSLAINRAEIVANVTQMHQVPATALIPGRLWDKEPPSYFCDHDPVEAQRCFNLGLQELGLSKTQFPKVSLNYHSLAGHHKIAQAIQQQWKAVLGVDAVLANQEWKVFLNALKQGDFQIARMGFLSVTTDPLAFLDPYRYRSPSLNPSGWSNDLFSRLIEQAEGTSDPSKRLELLQQAEEVLILEMPLTPIYFYKGVYTKKPYVKGVLLSEFNLLDLKRAYVAIDD